MLKFVEKDAKSIPKAPLFEMVQNEMKEGEREKKNVSKIFE